MSEPYDYRCLNGHVFASPAAPHGGPWATLVCPRCGATSTRHLPDVERLVKENQEILDRLGDDDVVYP